MLLATIILLGALPQSSALARSVANLPEAVASDAKIDAKDSGAARELPSMPKPKVSMDAEGDGVTANVAGAEAVQPPRVALPVQPVKAAYTRPRETRGQRVGWYALAVTGHGAAAFDAYSTRLALSGNYGTESNPLLRPFAHSGALYAGDGFYRQAHDGQRESLGAEDVVVAAGRRLRIFDCGRRAQYGRGEIAQLGSVASQEFFTRAHKKAVPATLSRRDGF